MNPSSYSQEQQRIYRIDKFIVSEPARAEFLERVKHTHELLRILPGFIEDSILEKMDGPGDFNLVTIVVWWDAEAIAAAKEAVTARHQETGFDPRETFDRLGVQADLVNYRQIDAWKYSNV
ncbi:MAG: antibiotic biosynthesis monooxygenase [Rubrobacteraceae bacterium]|nr:antibiotic biosynthesis monooxygenase [Rubrobacter sp.]